MSNEVRLPIIGNLTADPELRYTQNGLAVANFTIASTPREFDRQSGEQRDGEPLFMRCTVWREFAEHVAGSLTKGLRVVAYGRLRQRRYETEDGDKRTSWELDVEAIGPDLRWATASVTKATSGQQGAPSPAPSAQQSGGWYEPGQSAATYDETPF